MIFRGSREFRRANLAMVAAGFATFELMYCVQPLLPVFVRVFGVTPLGSSFALSMTTGSLALALLVASALSETLGRTPMMISAILMAAALTIASSVIGDWGPFLLMRAAIGVVLSGLPAVAMAYLAEEVDRESIGLAMGLYVAGSGFGGMTGRLLTEIVADAAGWRIAIAVVGAIGLAAGLVVMVALPRSRHFVPRPFAVRQLAFNYLDHLRDPALVPLFLEAFLIMGAFVSVYNYITFRLLGPHFGLSQSHVGLIFAVYLVGVVSSAWVGGIAGRVGRARALPVAIAVELLGVLLTLSGNLGLVVLGIALATFGFFGAHSVASSWVGLRARSNRAQAAALYLFLYYLGSSVIGSASGVAYGKAGWDGVVIFIAALLFGALGVARLVAILPSRAGAVM
jgi:YNFM family putative membrane transporter